MLNLTVDELSIIKSILSNYPYSFYAFGSRVKDKHKRFSDLDICYKDPIPDSVISKINEAFEESNLPYKIELINWNRCDPEFQHLIEKDFVKI